MMVINDDDYHGDGEHDAVHADAADVDDVHLNVAA